MYVFFWIHLKLQTVIIKCAGNTKWLKLYFRREKKKITRTKKTWKNNFTIQRDKNHPTQDQIVVEINGKLKAVEIWTKQKLLVAFYLICIEVFFFWKNKFQINCKKFDLKKLSHCLIFQSPFMAAIFFFISYYSYIYIHYSFSFAVAP